ncbi:MAG: hypothetical protein J3R72DRAFT_20749 [Linnemannia gamsii]|nr:MAG: hypothetical protein J3R72DRAFT_20749 [Linnemannia gamsii]
MFVASILLTSILSNRQADQPVQYPTPFHLHSSSLSPAYSCDPFVPFLILAEQKRVIIITGNSPYTSSIDKVREKDNGNLSMSPNDPLYVSTMPFSFLPTSCYAPHPSFPSLYPPQLCSANLRALDYRIFVLACSLFLSVLLAPPITPLFFTLRFFSFLFQIPFFPSSFSSLSSLSSFLPFLPFLSSFPPLIPPALFSCFSFFFGDTVITLPRCCLSQIHSGPRDSKTLFYRGRNSLFLSSPGSPFALKHLTTHTTIRTHNDDDKGNLKTETQGEVTASNSNNNKQ